MQSSTAALLSVPLAPCGTKGVADRTLFLGVASCLDAFSSYPQWLSCPAMPSRTTGTPEATPRCSSRTGQGFPSVFFRFHQVEADLSHDGLTQLTFPFNGRAAPPLAPAAGPGWEEPTSQSDLRFLPGLDYVFTLPHFLRPPCEDLEQRRGWRMMTRSLSRPPDFCRDTSDVPRRETAPSHLIAPHIMRAQSLRGHMGRSFYL